MVGRMIFRTIVLGLLAAFIAAQASAQSANPPAIQAVDVWARATPLGAHTGAAYMTLINKGAADDRLLGVSTPIAGEAQIHSMSLDNGVMMMRPVPALDLKAGSTQRLAPGGYHVMLMDLKAPLVEGQSFPLTLIFAKAGKVGVTAKIGGIGAMAPPAAKP